MTWDWRTPIIQYLQADQLPPDKAEAKKLRIRAARFCLINGDLYKRSYSGPYYRCIGPAEGRAALRELHDGECGNHAGGRSLAAKALRAGYYWPTMRRDAIDTVRRCDSCQRHARVSHVPPEKLHNITAPWPFMKWGMDIVGKLPPAPGQLVYMLVLTDYFTKWIEAAPFAQVKESNVVNFVWKNLICRAFQGKSYATTVPSSSAQSLGSSARTGASSSTSPHQGIRNQMARLKQATKSSSTP